MRSYASSTDSLAAWRIKLDTPPRAFALASRGVFIGNAAMGNGKRPVVD